MQDTITQLGKLLESTDTNILIQATEICKSQTAVEGQIHYFIPLIKHFLKLTSSTDPTVAENVLISLINMTHVHLNAVQDIVKENGVSRLLDSVIGPDVDNCNYRLMLLTNLTGLNEGCKQLLDLEDETIKGQRLLRLAVRFTLPLDSNELPQATFRKGVPMVQDQDPYEYASMVLMNATQIPEGRAIFYENPKFFMPALLSAMSSQNNIRKQGIIGVVRNLCFDQSKHDYLLHTVNILPYVVKPLVPKTITNNYTAAEMLKNSFPEVNFGDPEPVILNRRNLLETLMLLVQSEVGKKELVHRNVIFAMREFDEFETDEENKNSGLRLGAILIGPPPENEENSIPSPSTQGTLDPD